mmetsp:Transcript_15452/g.33469  ORF Transcript_15452/g.33469 Transcript_15452/m.33469 type:complete len:417 (-) Transcript_15452:78-1328(-)
MTTRNLIGVIAALLASNGRAFTPTITPYTPKSALNAITGHDRRSGWETYAPLFSDGKVGASGEIGCVGGGDWCHGENDDVSSALSTPGYVTAAVNVATALDGMGGQQATSSPPKNYGIGSWNKNSSSGTIASPTTPSAGESSKIRRPIVAGNWKLNPATKGEAITLLKLLAANFVNHRDGMSTTGAPEAVIFPPLPYITDAVQILEGSGIQVGAQNAGPNEKGAFTGECAPSMLASSGCSYVLLGHSERRTVFGETDEHINNVLHKCLDQPSLKIIFCVGETLHEYENGMLEHVVDTQIRKGLEGIDANTLLSDRVIIAYEPVWAIGTGLVATPDQAQAAHVAIRNSLANFYGTSEVAESVRIQYGGSVTPESIEQLMGEMDVDGALVGGASLNADSFTRIFDGAASADSKKASSN